MEVVGVRPGRRGPRVNKLNLTIKRSYLLVKAAVEVVEAEVVEVEVVKAEVVKEEVVKAEVV